ncbi:MAG TPA: antibiotic biosynthesis monooxygenase family protein [Chloroflexota bacterium]|nr:antibiotic biosynthesis monooxygenase family protein [Chloroflexota bacterium]
MAEHAGVIRVSHFTPGPGKHEDLKARLNDGLAELRASEGCFGAQICTVREKPNELAVVSRWASGAALDRYLQQRVANVATLADVLAQAPQVEHFDSA